MAKGEEWKARRRERRAASRKAHEEAIMEYEKRIRERAGPGPYDNIICYRCHGKGHFAAKCSKPRKGKDEEAKLFRSEISCFKCKKKGHFLNHCPMLRKEKRKPVVPVNGSTICYHCKGSGHIARNCPKRQKQKKVMELPANGVTVIQDGNIQFFCGKCKKWGHPVMDCTDSLDQVSGKT